MDAVKDLTEEEILNKSDSLLHSAEKSVKTDITKQFHSVRPSLPPHPLFLPPRMLHERGSHAIITFRINAALF